MKSQKLNHKEGKYKNEKEIGKKVKEFNFDGDEQENKSTNNNFKDFNFVKNSCKDININLQEKIMLTHINI